MNRGLVYGVLSATVLVSGCAGPMFEGTIFEQPPPRSDTAAVKTANAAPQVSADMRQLSDRIDALNRSIEVVNSRLDRLEAQPKTASGAQDDLVGIRRDIQMIRSERETLKREITDDLASRIEKIAARQQAEIRAAAQTAPAPSVSTRAAPASSSSVRASSSARAGKTSTRSGYEHKVERGQTLSEIAKGYGTTVDAIMKANKLPNASAIRVGQVLFIPD
jgi:LysM repeat protein